MKCRNYAEDEDAEGSTLWEAVDKNGVEDRNDGLDKDDVDKNGVEDRNYVDKDDDDCYYLH